MSRTMRERSQTGIYHVMLRGINQQTIFNDEEDTDKFLEVMQECKTLSGFKLYAYCLMGNHVHLLIKEEKEPLSQILKRIGVRYVYWYNWKYYRRGHLFQDRFKSEIVEDDSYFLTVLRYIHQNPIKAGIVKNLDEYKNSSYQEYVSESTLTDTKFAIDMIGIDEFKRYHAEKNKDKCLEYDFTNYRMTDAEAKIVIKRVSQCDNAEGFLKLDESIKKQYIARFKDEGMSIRQISRLTGVSFGIVRTL